jgi:uncharacterized GH25 family protein
MIKKILLAVFVVVLFCSHDMFLKLDTYFLSPNSPTVIQLFNGTFEKSDNVITRDRMIDVSIVSNGKRTRVDTSNWSEKDSMTLLSVNTGDAGTWVVGVSTRARSIEMEAEAFNGYLEHDGVFDMLDYRKEKNLLDQNAIEKYSKHVKAIYQVGDERTDDWQTKLDYPIEFVPLSNPYETHAGHDLEVQLLWQGEPLANQLVYVASEERGHSHSHGDEAAHSHSDSEDQAHDHSHDDGHTHSHDHADADAHKHEGDHAHSHDDGEAHTHSEEAEAHTHTDATQLRTDTEGKVTMNLTNDGIWYLRTIHLVESAEEGFTHESNWATLTFEVGHGDHSHGENDHVHGDHDHAHEHEGGLPGYAYWLGSLALVLGLFFYFNRSK